MIKSKITRVEIIPTQIPLSETFHISKGPLDKASITVVKLYSNQGVYGIGECTPFRTKFTESQESSVAAGRILSQIMIGQDPMRINTLIDQMDQQFVGPASIKSAFDMALHDLKAKLLGIPLYQLLGGDPSITMLTDRTVSLNSSKKMVDQALKFYQQGFHILKVKLGQRPCDKDIDRIEHIRAALGPDALLKIDANQGWNLIEAQKALAEMYQFDIDLRYLTQVLLSQLWETNRYIVLWMHLRL